MSVFCTKRGWGPGNECEVMCEGGGEGEGDDSKMPPLPARQSWIRTLPMTTTLNICHNKIFYKMLL